MSESKDAGGSALPGESASEPGDPYDPKPGPLHCRARDVNRPFGPLP